MQLNVLNDLAKAKRALDGKKQAAKFALGAPGWGPGFRTVLYWFCPYRLGYGDRVMWCSVLLCLLFAIPTPGMMQCHHLSQSWHCVCFFSSSLARSLQLALCLVCCFCCFFFLLFVVLVLFLCGWHLLRLSFATHFSEEGWILIQKLITAAGNSVLNDLARVKRRRTEKSHFTFGHFALFGFSGNIRKIPRKAYFCEAGPDWKVGRSFWAKTILRRFSSPELGPSEQVVL